MIRVLRDYALGDVLREATDSEAKASRRARGMGSFGKIRVEDYPFQVYVDEDPHPSAIDRWRRAQGGGDGA